MHHAPLMARFNAWANQRLDEAVRELPEDAYRQDAGLFFGSMHRTLNHLLVVDRLWTGRIRGTEHGIRSLDQILHDDRQALRRARAEEAERLIALVDELDDERLRQPVRYRRMIGEGLEEARVGHILLTLFNHQTHHRGQIHAALTRIGITPPSLDVIFFLEAIGESGPPGTLLPAG